MGLLVPSLVDIIRFTNIPEMDGELVILHSFMARSFVTELQFPHPHTIDAVLSNSTEQRSYLDIDCKAILINRQRPAIATVLWRRERRTC